MQKQNRITNYILLILIFSVVLFSISGILGHLDQNYFKTHKEELTTIEHIELPDGAIDNYYYEKTPYTILYNISIITYLIISSFITIYLSAKYVIIKKSIRKSLLISLSFIPITFLLFAKGIYNAVGWERDFGIFLIGTYVGLTFILSLITNLIIYYNKTKENPF